MEYKDYYQVLGVARTATQDEIKRVYRKLARKYHPDVSKEPDAEARFKALGEAYEVLKDSEKRAAYDQLGTNWRQGQEFKPPPGWDRGFGFSRGGFAGGVGAPDTEGFGAGGFSDFFETLFGRSGVGRGVPLDLRGEDHAARIGITLEEAYQGATRSMTLETPQVDAQGRVTTQARTLNIKIPPGVTEGSRIRVPGQGASGMGRGEAGDLYLEIHFEPHRLFRVEGRDVYLELPVTPWEVALGATVTVPTLGGKVDLKIPTDSQAGKQLRLKGRGLPGKTPGDLYVVLKIVTPPATTAQARAVYEQMSQVMPFNPRVEFGG